MKNIKTPEDILNYMDEIKYGWIGIDNKKRTKTMKNFRKYYRTLSVEDTIKNKIGTCIEQVYLMKHLFDKIGIKSKMYCARMYEGKDFDNLEADERMHCFILFFDNNKVYQMEHPHIERKGIYEYKTEEDAIKYIVKIYENMMEEDYKEKNLEPPKNGFKRTVTEYFKVTPNISYKEFNLYVNSLDKK